jgi:hypothetical protein
VLFLSEKNRLKHNASTGFQNAGEATDPMVGTSFTESTNASDATDPIAASSNATATTRKNIIAIIAHLKQ